MGYHSIAIDGPSGAGKSTLAKLLAQELGFLYVDTGAIYRTVGLAVRDRGIDPADLPAVTALLSEIGIAMGYGKDGLQHMFLDGADVTGAIRQNAISDYASKVSPIPEVRAFLMGMQRQMAQEHDVIMDGRDIGTVVLPQADLKIFLTAVPEERARRRCRELLERGQQADYGQVLREVEERDRRDSQRAAAPLRQAADAVLVDTTGLDLEESLDRLLKLVWERLGRGKGEADE
ncbi:MAG: (d)CMP kinase [Oscillospiraceae bacterium]